MKQKLEIIKNKIYYKLFNYFHSKYGNSCKKLNTIVYSKQDENFNKFTFKNTLKCSVDKNIYNNNPGYSNIDYSIPPEYLMFSDGPINKGEFLNTKLYGL